MSYGNGEQAIEEIKNDLIYDLALIDLSIEKRDGSEVAKTSKEINPEVSVLYISFLASHKIQSSLGCADGYIHKPMTPSEDLKEIADRYLE